jgi:iron complex transport system substrate-binding protein
VATDLMGRVVTLAKAPGRIVLLEARDILTMAAIHPAPASLVVGWAATDRIDSDVLREAHEATAGHPIAVVGAQGPETLSLESLVALSPDLVIASAYAGGGSRDLVQRLEAAGIPVVFTDVADNVDGRDRHDDLARRMRLWGRILGREAQAEAYLAFAAESLARVRRCLEGAETVKTYLEVQSTYDACCWAAGTAIWGVLLAEGGGRSLDSVTAPWFQQISDERLVTEDPGLYIASGGGFASTIRPPIAPGLPVGAARAGLRRLAERNALAHSRAVREAHVHGIWTGLIGVAPLNPLFVELVATWSHPERCAAIRPHETLAAMNRRFFAVPVPEGCWVNLQDDEP